MLDIRNLDSVQAQFHVEWSIASTMIDHLQSSGPEGTNMKKKNHYQYLIGRDKKQIAHEMGQEFNFYPNNIWTYIIDNGWFGKKTILLLFFKSEKVYEVKVKNFYGKISILSEG